MSKELKVALLGIVALAALYIGFNFLKGSNLLSSDRTYFAKYDNVDGLTVGNPVILNGVKVGQVREMHLMRQTTGGAYSSNSIRISWSATLPGQLVGYPTSWPR